MASKSKFKSKKLFQMKIVSHSGNAPTPEDLWKREGPGGTQWMKTIAGYTVNDDDKKDEPLHIAIIQLKRGINRKGARKHLAASRWSIIEILVEDLQAEVIELIKAKKTFKVGKFKIPSSDSEDSGEELVWDDNHEVVSKKRDREESKDIEEPKAKKPKVVQAKDPKLFSIPKTVALIKKKSKQYAATQELEDVDNDEEEIGEEFEKDD